ncbi:MAG: hypothetical protein NTX31_08735, partial [Burkholderiales bacterium]|nr:hypothetical protein [Burkholderiales bacterium]
MPEKRKISLDTRQNPQGLQSHKFDRYQDCLQIGAKMRDMNPQTLKVACSNCNLRELCMPVDLSKEELDRVDDLVGARRKIKRGTTLFR